MKAITALFAAVIAAFLIGCGGGSTSADSSSSSTGTTGTSSSSSAAVAQFETNQTVTSMQETVIKVAGRGNDLLTVTIPKLPFGQAEDRNVSFKLAYDDTNTLPEIQIGADIEFDAAVTLQFRSDNLNSDEYMFVYHGNSQDYFVPFVKNENVYTAKLLHFSDYGFDGRPSRSALINDIEIGLDILKEYKGDDGLYGLDRDLAGDIFVKIYALEKIDSALDQNYREQLIDIINAAVDRWMIKMKQTTPTYWNGYCIHDDFQSYMVELVQTMTEMEVIGAKSIDADVKSLINKHMQAAYEEWKSITPPTPCDIGNMLKYIKCAVKFAKEAEANGVNISWDEQMDIVKNYVENNVLYVINHADCSQLKCVKHYLNMSKNHEFEYMGIGSDYTEELQAKVDELEKKIKNGECALWRLHINFVMPSMASGTVTYKNFTLNCDDPIHTYGGDDCAYLSSTDYTDVRLANEGKPSLATASYSGDLAVDSELEPLIIDSEGIHFNALNTSESGYMFDQVGSLIRESSSSHGPVSRCFGNFAANTLSNIKAGKQSEWSSMTKGDGFAYCDFVLEPCKDKECNAN